MCHARADWQRLARVGGAAWCSCPFILYMPLCQAGALRHLVVFWTVAMEMKIDVFHKADASGLYTVRLKLSPESHTCTHTHTIKRSL